jgi:diguanylate cyclase (GGDEF)-like protein
MRPLFGRRPDPYAGADRATTRRFQSGLVGLCGFLALLFLPFAPVDEELGWVGWPIAIAIGVAAVGGAIAMGRRQPSFDDLLVIAYVGIAAIASLNYLAGGRSAYEDLFVLWLGTGAPHPPRRALAHLAVLLCALALPLLYESDTGEVIDEIAPKALILITVGVLLTAYQARVREQRAGLREGAAVARRLARVDELTGLGNRRAFDEALTVEIGRAAQARLPLSLGLIDVENLKRINDRTGHLEGDRILGEVARALERSARESDRCFRWGGDEFVVLMPGTDRAGADRLLARMAETVAQTCEAPDGHAVALTVGAATLEPGQSPEDLLAAADVSLLEQKTDKSR